MLVARGGVVFLHQAFNGFKPDSLFDGASLGKTVGGLLFARFVDQNLLTFDTPVSAVFPEWAVDNTRHVTFRHCFNHVAGLRGHRSHDGLFNAYLDNALLTQDVAFARPGRAFRYNGDDYNLAGKALELTTGTPIWRLLHEQVQQPFAEPVMQTDLGGAAQFNAMYLAKVGQMLLQDGAYSGHRFFRPGMVRALLPRAISDFAPELEDKHLEAGIGLTWMTDPAGPRAKGVLGPNVIGHPAASGVVWRVALDRQVVVVIGRSEFKSADDHELWVSRFIAAVAAGLAD